MHVWMHTRIHTYVQGVIRATIRAIIRAAIQTMINTIIRAVIRTLIRARILAELRAIIWAVVRAIIRAGSQNEPRGAELEQPDLITGCYGPGKLKIKSVWPRVPREAKMSPGSRTGANGFYFGPLGP